MKILDLLFPPVCLSCSKKGVSSDGYLCEECFLKIDILDSHTCQKCALPTLGEEVCYLCLQKPNEFISYMSSFCKYSNIGANLVKKFKYYQNQRIGKFIAERMFSSSYSLIQEADFLCPVPMRYSRFLIRHFNHSDFIARILARKSKTEIISNLLLKTQGTKTNAMLSKEERENNISSSFTINKKHIDLIRGKKILLVDDVITTTATTTACAKILKNFGAKDVSAISFARTIL